MSTNDVTVGEFREFVTATERDMTHPRNNSGQSWASRAQTLALGRIGQDGTNMLAREVWEVFKDLIFGHPTGEVLEDIGRSDAGSKKRRLPAAHAGVI